MKIRAGYEISYDCPQPTPMILTAERSSVAHWPISSLGIASSSSPPIPVNTYHDSFGNFCHVIRAPAGRLTMSTDFLVQDNGKPDTIASASAQQHALEDLPVDVSDLSAWQPLLRDRPPVGLRRGRCSGIVPKGWPLVQAICDYVHERIKFGYEHASPTKTAFDVHNERRGVCRDFAHLAITLCRCMNIPARYCTGYLGDIGVPVDHGADGFQRMVRGLSRRPLVHVRCAPQQSAYRPHPDGARTRRDRRRDRDVVRSMHARSFKVITEEITSIKPGDTNEITGTN